MCPDLFWLKYLRRLWWGLWNESLQHPSLQYFIVTRLAYQTDLTQISNRIYILNLASLLRGVFQRTGTVKFVYDMCSLAVTHMCTLNQCQSAGFYWGEGQRLNSFNRGWWTEDKWRTADHLDRLRRPSLVPLRLKIKSVNFLFILNSPPFLVFQLLRRHCAFGAICKIRFKHLHPKSWPRKSFFLNCKSVISAEGKQIPRRRRSKIFSGS